jgi:hypothetical protein
VAANPGAHPENGVVKHEGVNGTIQKISSAYCFTLIKYKYS